MHPWGSLLGQDTAEIAAAMEDNGYSVEVIAESLGVTVERVQALLLAFEEWLSLRRGPSYCETPDRHKGIDYDL